MTSYTNARPGVGLLVVDLDHGLRTPRVTVPHLADEREIGSGGPVKAVLKR